MSDLVRAIRGLLAYTMRADRQLLDAVAEVPHEELTRPTGSSFGSVLATMAHILGAEQLWLSRFLGVPLQRVPGIEDFPTTELLRASFEDYWPQLEFFLAALTEEEIARDFSWTNTRGESHSVPLRQALLHLVNHSTYHRGQVVSQLRQLGRPAPSTDLVHWRGSV